MKENKKMMIVVIILGIIALLVTALTINEFKNQKEQLKIFDKYLNSTSNQLVYFAKDGCYYCELMESAKKELLDDKKIDYYFVNTSNTNKAVLDKMLSKLEITKFGTPTLVIVKDGKVVYNQSGVFSDQTDNKTELKSFLEQYEIIEKSE